MMVNGNRKYLNSHSCYRYVTGQCGLFACGTGGEGDSATLLASFKKLTDFVCFWWDVCTYL